MAPLGTHGGALRVGYREAPCTLSETARARPKLVPVGEHGERLGEHHQNAKLLDKQVEEIRDRYDAGLDGTGPRIGYRLLAKEYGVSKRTIRDIISMKRRNQYAARWKRV